MKMWALSNKIEALVVWGGGGGGGGGEGSTLHSTMTTEIYRVCTNVWFSTGVCCLLLNVDCLKCVFLLIYAINIVWYDLYGYLGIHFLPYFHICGVLSCAELKASKKQLHWGKAV